MTLIIAKLAFTALCLWTSYDLGYDQGRSDAEDEQHTPPN